jgi:hypothetical protein
MNLDKEKRADPKPRKTFKNVEINIHKNPISDYEYRPRVNRLEDIMKLAEEIKGTPNGVVNFLVDIGLECFERAIPKLKDDLKKEVSKKISKLLK